MDFRKKPRPSALETIVAEDDTKKLNSPKKRLHVRFFNGVHRKLKPALPWIQVIAGIAFLAAIAALILAFRQEIKDDSITSITRIIPSAGGGNGSLDLYELPYPGGGPASLVAAAMTNLTVDAGPNGVSVGPGGLLTFRIPGGITFRDTGGIIAPVGNFTPLNILVENGLILTAIGPNPGDLQLSLNTTAIDILAGDTNVYLQDGDLIGNRLLDLAGYSFAFEDTTAPGTPRLLIESLRLDNYPGLWAPLNQQNSIVLAGPPTDGDLVVLISANNPNNTFTIANTNDEPLLEVNAATGALRLNTYGGGVHLAPNVTDLTYLFATDADGNVYEVLLNQINPSLLAFDENDPLDGARRRFAVVEGWKKINCLGGGVNCFYTGSPGTATLNINVTATEGILLNGARVTNLTLVGGTFSPEGPTLTLPNYQNTQMTLEANGTLVLVQADGTTVTQSLLGLIPPDVDGNFTVDVFDFNPVTGVLTLGQATGNTQFVQLAPGENATNELITSDFSGPGPGEHTVGYPTGATYTLNLTDTVLAIVSGENPTNDLPIGYTNGPDPGIVSHLYPNNFTFVYNITDAVNSLLPADIDVDYDITSAFFNLTDSTATIIQASGNQVTFSINVDGDNPTNQLITGYVVNATAQTLTLFEGQAPSNISIVIDLSPLLQFVTATASNVGTGGVGPFKQKTANDLEFKNINAGSNKITVTDDTGNNEIDIDVDEANIDHDQLLNFVANEHVDHTTIGVTAGIGLVGGGDATATRTIDLDIPSLPDDTSPTLNYTLAMFDGLSVHKEVTLADLQALIDTNTNTGEDNTASNQGAGGVGPFKQKTGIDLEFKNVNAGSSKVSVTDDTGNNEIDIDVVEAQIDHDQLLNYATNDHIDHSMVSIVGGEGLAGGGDLTSSRTISLNISSLPDEVSPALNYTMVVWDADTSSHKEVTLADLQDLIDTDTNTGEDNTASNQGAGGVGPFKQKTGIDLEFKNVNAGSSKVTVTDDTPNNEIDIDVDEAAIDHDALLNFVGNEHIDHSNVTLIAGIGLTGGGDITASRTIDLDIPGLPDETSPALNYTMVVWDADTSSHKEVTLSNLQDLIDTDTNTLLTIQRDASTVGAAAEVVTLNFAGSSVASVVDNGSGVRTITLEAVIPSDIDFAGTWNASLGIDPATNPSIGDHYLVSHAGSTDLNGTTSWHPGDHVIWTGTIWSKIDNTEAGLVVQKDDALVQTSTYTLNLKGDVVVTVVNDGAGKVTATFTDATTASNVGTGGVGPFKQENVNDIEFKNINAGSTKVTVTDDTGNDEIDIDIVENQIDHDALLNFVSNEHIDHTTVGVIAGIGLSGGGDATATRTIDLDIPSLPDDTSPVLNYTLAMFDGLSSHKEVSLTNLQALIDTDTNTDNTASNQGAGGVGPFKQKTGLDLEFKNINAGSTKVTVTDDPGNDEIDIDIVENQIDHDALLNFAANNHIDHTTIGVNAGVGLSGGGDATATRTIDLDIPGLPDDTSPALNYTVAMFDGLSVHKEVSLADLQALIDTDTNTDNTASNQGVGGVGPFKQKTGLDLEFKNVNAGSTKVTVTDDPGNNEIDIDIVENQIDHDALLNFAGNEHIDHTTIGVTAGVGLTGGGDATATRTIDLNIPSLPDESTPQLNYTMVVWDADSASHKEVTLSDLQSLVDTDTDTNTGEVNTASNQGTGGVGPFLQKTGDDLEFKNINAASLKVTVVNDPGNNEIDIDVVEAQIDHDALLNFVGNEHVDHSTVSVNAGVGLSGGGDLTTTRTINMDIPGLPDDTSPVLNYTLAMFDGLSSHKEVSLADLQALIDTDTNTDNTASNQGAGGVGPFKQKTGLDLEFKSINAGSTKVTVTDDPGNNEIDIDIVENQIDHDALLNFADNEHVDHSNVTLTAGIGLTGGGDLTASRTFDMDIPGLPNFASPILADTFALYDSTGTAHKEVTLANLKSLIDTLMTIQKDDVNVGTSATVTTLNFEGSSVASVVDDGAGKRTVTLEAVIPSDIDFAGTWNASLGTEPATNPKVGDHYLVSGAGSTSLNGTTSWNPGDHVIWTGTIWSKIDNTEAGLIVQKDDTTVQQSTFTLNLKGDVVVTVVNDGAGKVTATFTDPTTASNVGTGGVGPFKQETANNLEFKTINAGSNKITVTDDTGNDEIDIDIDQANIDHDALLNFVGNEHIDHTTIGVTAGIGLMGGGDATSTRTIDLNIPELPDEPSPQLNYTLAAWDADSATHKEISLEDLQTLIDTDTNTGEVNTASNIGASGFGLFYQKNGVDLEFSKLYSPLGTLNMGTGDNGEVTIDVDESNVDHDALFNYESNEHVDHAQVFVKGADGLSGEGDITSNVTLVLNIPSLEDQTSPSLADSIAIWDNGLGAHREVTLANLQALIDTDTDTGEVNMASNQGVGGVGPFKQKTGIDLEFKNINAGSSKVTVTDDTGNSEIDIDIVENQIDHDALGGFVANEHVDHTTIGVTAGIGLVGGGDATATRTIDLNIPELPDEPSPQLNYTLAAWDGDTSTHKEVTLEDLQTLVDTQLTLLDDGSVEGTGILSLECIGNKLVCNATGTQGYISTVPLAVNSDFNGPVSSDTFRMDFSPYFNVTVIPGVNGGVYVSKRETRNICETPFIQVGTEQAQEITTEWTPITFQYMPYSLLLDAIEWVTGSSNVTITAKGPYEITYSYNLLYDAFSIDDDVRVEVALFKNGVQEHLVHTYPYGRNGSRAQSGTFTSHPDDVNGPTVYSIQTRVTGPTGLITLDDDSETTLRIVSLVPRCREVFADVPTPAPTLFATLAPTTATPTATPSDAPTATPTTSPTSIPTAGPTAAPSFAPTFAPSFAPSAAPTTSPTAGPTHSPTQSPTFGPTMVPTAGPTVAPTTGTPSAIPTSAPTFTPTQIPTLAPSSPNPPGSLEIKDEGGSIGLYNSIDLVGEQAAATNLGAANARFTLSPYTVSNVGANGIGVYSTKTGLDFEMRKLHSPLGTISLATAPGGEIELDVNTVIEGQDNGVQVVPAIDTINCAGNILTCNQGASGEFVINATTSPCTDAYLSISSSGASQSITTTETLVDWDTQDIETNSNIIEWDAGGTTTQVTVKEDGVYEVGWAMNVATTDGQTCISNGYVIRIRIGGLAGTNVFQLQDEEFPYQSDATRVQSSMSRWTYLDLTAGDTIVMTSQQLTACPGMVVDSDPPPSMMIRKTGSCQGPKGDTGAGANIITQDEDVTLGITTDTITFNGAGVTATHSAGKTTVTVPGATSVFGSEWQQGLTTTTSSTNSVSFVQYYRLTTTSVPAGTYRIGYSLTWRYDDTGRNCRIRVQVDDSVNMVPNALGYLEIEPQDAGADQRLPASGFGYATFGSTSTHTIDVDYSAESTGDLCFLYGAQLEFWRVA